MIVHIQTQTKLFMGYRLQAELKMHAEASLSWKLAKHLSSNSLENPLGIHEISFRGREYLGIYMEGHHIPLPLLMETFSYLSQEVLRFFPELSEKSLQPVLFSQTFIL